MIGRILHVLVDSLLDQFNGDCSLQVGGEASKILQVEMSALPGEGSSAISMASPVGWLWMLAAPVANV